jgi:hypothetical protein
LQRASEFPRLRRVGDRCGCQIPRRHANKRGRSRSWQQLTTRPPHATTGRTTRRLGRLDPLARRSAQGQTRQQQPPRLTQTRLAMPAAQQAVVPNLHEALRQHVLHEATQQLLRCMSSIIRCRNAVIRASPSRKESAPGESSSVNARQEKEKPRRRLSTPRSRIVLQGSDHR